MNRLGIISIISILFFTLSSHAQRMQAVYGKVKDGKISNLKELAKARYVDLGSQKTLVDLKEIKALKAVQRLDLTQTGVVDISPIRYCAKYLTELHLNDTMITDAKGIKYLKKLKKLYIHDTKLVNADDLKGLKYLEELYIQNTEIKDLSFLRGMKSLKILNISGTKVEKLEDLKQVTNSLEKLTAGNIPAKDYSVIPSLKKLYDLNLEEFKPDNIDFLKGMTKLKNLSLNSGFIKSYDVLNTLTNIERINLANSNAETLKPLYGLKKLIFVDIEDAEIPKEDFKKFVFQSNPDCRVNRD